MDKKSFIPPGWELPQEIRDRLGDGAGRQRAMSADSHLLLVMHAPPKRDQDEREGRLFWFDPSNAWQSNMPGPGSSALDRHLNEYQDRIDQLEAHEVAASSAEDYYGVIEDLAPLHRAAGNMFEVLQDARKMRPSEYELINYRDRAYQVQRTADLLYSGAKAALDFAIAKRTEEQAAASQKMAESAHRLNMLVAFFFPLATLTALFGTNLPSGLEKFPAPWAFCGLILAALIAGAILSVIVTRNSK